MKKRTLLILFSNLLIISSCANRPSVENYARFDTVDIAQKIRCEVREAVRKQTFAFLERRTKQTPRYSKLLSFIKEDEGNLATLFEEAEDLLEKRDAAVVRRYEVAAFAYEFTFDLTENNDTSGGADFLDPLTRGVIKLGVSAEKKRKRRLLRNFKLLDNFRDLATSPVMIRVCNNLKTGQSRNYPITGSLRFDETLGTFFTLNQSGGLVGGITGIQAGTGQPKIADVPAMADTIEFTTELSGSLSPSIELSAVGSNFQLAKANIGTSAKRIDIHKLIFIAALPSPGDKVNSVKTVVAQRALSELGRQRRNENREEIITNLLD